MPNKDDYDWYCMMDPGTAGSAFATLFVAVDPYLPHIFLLDEIYETEPESTVTGNIAPKIHSKALHYNDDLTKWKAYYDSAAAWFGEHYRQRYKDTEDCLRLAPVHKTPGEKEYGLDVINELLLGNRISISTKCPNTIWEMDNYRRMADGRLPKKHDHQIDNLRYLIKMAGIVAGVTVNKPSRSAIRKARLTRDYTRKKPVHEGKLNLISRVINSYK